jgi:hypothetical protein
VNPEDDPDLKTAHRWVVERRWEFDDLQKALAFWRRSSTLSCIYGIHDTDRFPPEGNGHG